MAGGHGGNLRELARRAGVAPDRLLDFSASINPLGPPEGLRPALARAVDSLEHYPDPDCAELVGLFARRHGAAPEQVVAGNGSTEIFFALARALPYARAVIPAPSYIDYAAAVRAAGRPVDCVPLGERAGFALDWQALAGALRGDEIVWLGQPNNPTGRTFDSGEFRRLASAHPSTMFVIDEAFADFVAGYRSLAETPAPNLLVVRSLTKFYAMPGLRLGYAIGSPDVIRRIRGQVPPWSVNAMAQAAGEVLLADLEYARRTVALVQQQRSLLAGALAALPGVTVLPGEANYLLARLDRTDLTAADLAERLLREGMAIRTFTPEQHLDDRYFRVAVRTESENRRLESAMAAALGAKVAAFVPPRRPAARALMIQGTSSSAGKSVLTTALCRILLQDGLRVAPFKSQNMSLNSFVARDGGEMGRAQVVQAQACRLEPEVRMNPILLKPNSDTDCQVIVRGRPVGNMRIGQYVRYKPEAFAAAQACYDSLAAEFDAVILEGAGSPGEVNLKSHDIVNMRMAEYANAPVLIVGDIDRGGVFASFVGTMEVLASWERARVAGWIVNRFRGDASLLAPALDYTLRHTGRPVLGVVPHLPNLNLPQEDSVEFKSGAADSRSGDAWAADAQPSDGPRVDIAVIDLPHISNFTDFDALRIERDVRLRIVRSAAELGRPDAVILPGSKNTLGDLDYLRRSGLAERIVALASEPDRVVEIVGICAGFQMLGREIRDPGEVESSAQCCNGLGLLDVQTVMAAEKTLVRTKARHALSGLDVVGYEIHHGRTHGGGCAPLLVGDGGEVVGAAGDDARVWGTYLHGVFDADAFRRWFLDRLRAGRGWPPAAGITGRYDIEPALDRLADAVRASLRIDDIHRIMGL
jgi:adenosylcobyric acid synthase